MANKKNFKGVADSYFSDTTQTTPIAQKASIVQKTQEAQIASTTQKVLVAPKTPSTQITPKASKRLNLYIQEGLLLDIKKIAGMEGKKVNSLICEALAEYVKTQSKAIEAYDQYHHLRRGG